MRTSAGRTPWVPRVIVFVRDVAHRLRLQPAKWQPWDRELPRRYLRARSPERARYCGAVLLVHLGLRPPDDRATVFSNGRLDAAHVDRRSLSGATARHHR